MPDLLEKAKERLEKQKALKEESKKIIKAPEVEPKILQEQKITAMPRSKKISKPKKQEKVKVEPAERTLLAFAGILGIKGYGQIKNKKDAIKLLRDYFNKL